MAEIFGGSLDDPRVTIHEGDVGNLIRSAKATYDAILLDVDNGPEGLTAEVNDALYDLAGLQAAREALRPGGVLAIWSQGPDENFTRRLGKAGFAVDTANKGRSGARHVVWIAVKTPPAGAIE